MIHKIEIQTYTPTDEQAWNAFVRGSKNGTFLLDRQYMDYHAERFQDASLLFYRGGKPFALLPAHRDGDKLISHAGLTYGGLILGDDARGEQVVALFQELNTHLRARGYQKVVYKRSPWIYHRQPAEEDLYALFAVCNAQLTGRDIASVIPMADALHWSQDRRWHRNKAIRQGVVVRQGDDLVPFWQVLSDNLRERYGVKPAHTLQEMQLLKSRFPDNIRLYEALLDGEVIGGTLLYVTPRVVHAQYISASHKGKETGAIDAIYEQVLHHDFTDHAYFDFGKSTERQGHYLNTSLLAQKEGFGARAVCYDTYEWTP